MDITIFEAVHNYSADMPTLLLIAGPTAVGKSSLAMRLAQDLKCSILSADSRQIYHEMDIGTAKPSPEDLQLVSHYFVNHKSITEYYSAGLYEKESLELLPALFDFNPIQIMTGGTGLYIEAVRHGLDAFPTVSRAINEQLEDELQSKGLTALVLELQTRDPDYAATADLQNPRRVMRALSVIRSTGHKYSQYLNQPKKVRPFHIMPILLTLPKAELHQRIHLRCDDMIGRGWLQEAEDLLPHQGLRSLQTVGYKQLFDHLQGKSNWEECVTDIKAKTRQYAKRQVTWFRKHGPWHEMDSRNIKQVLGLIYNHL